eukprot:Trichotokara_eunicae@DN4605_c0_g1_i4.p1
MRLKIGRVVAHTPDESAESSAMDKPLRGTSAEGRRKGVGFQEDEFDDQCDPTQSHSASWGSQKRKRVDDEENDFPTQKGAPTAGAEGDVSKDESAAVRAKRRPMASWLDFTGSLAKRRSSFSQQSDEEEDGTQGGLTRTMPARLGGTDGLMVNPPDRQSRTGGFQRQASATADVPVEQKTQFEEEFSDCDPGGDPEWSSSEEE